jgi:uncharacterized protein (DUF885 family)
VRADLERVRAIDTARLSHAMRTSVEVVRSAYATALEGFALPYGDVPSATGASRRTWSSRTSAPISTSRGFSTPSTAVETADDAEAYLARLQSYARQLDGELAPDAGARAQGWCRRPS